MLSSTETFCGELYAIWRIFSSRTFLELNLPLGYFLRTTLSPVSLETYSLSALKTSLRTRALEELELSLVIMAFFYYLCVNLRSIVGDIWGAAVVSERWTELRFSLDDCSLSFVSVTNVSATSLVSCLGATLRLPLGITSSFFKAGTLMAFVDDRLIILISCPEA